VHTINLYILNNPLVDVVLAVLVIVILAYVVKWVLNFIPILGG
jgi:hypothetical protein